MPPKRKGPSVRGGQPLDASRLCRGDVSSNAGNRLPTQDIKPFGSKLSTGAYRAPFSRRSRRIAARFLPPKSVKVQAIERKGLSGDEARRDVALPSYVIEPPPQTTCAWGLSPAETKRWATFGEHVERLVRSGDFVAFYLVVAAGHLTDDELLAIRRDVMRIIGKVQARCGMGAPIWGEVRETAGGMHFNIVILLPADAIGDIDVEYRDDGREVWRASSPFDGALTGNEARGIEQPDRFAKHNRPPLNGKRRQLFDLRLIQPRGLDAVIGYTLKEMSPQAHAAIHRARRRAPGSHRLEVGGDRVRMADGIELALTRAGKVKPRRKSYAKSKAKREAVRQPANVISSSLGESNDSAEQGENYNRQDGGFKGDELSVGHDATDGVEHGRRVHKRAPEFAVRSTAALALPLNNVFSTCGGETVHRQRDPGRIIAHRTGGSSRSPSSRRASSPAARNRGRGSGVWPRTAKKEVLVRRAPKGAPSRGRSMRPGRQ